MVREFKIDYSEEDWAEARDTVRKLRFFQRVLNDIDKAEDQLLDDENSFDLDDDFNFAFYFIFKGFNSWHFCKLLNRVNPVPHTNIALRLVLT